MSISLFAGDSPQAHGPHSAGCLAYTPEDFAEDRRAAEQFLTRSSRTRSPSSFAFWYPGADRSIHMRAQGEYPLGYPEGAVIHATEGRSLKGDYDLFNTMDEGRRQGYAYFGISRTGKVYQGLPLSEWGSHAGATQHPRLGARLSCRLVGIEVACAGLVRNYPGDFRPAWNERFAPDQVRYAAKVGNVTQAGYYAQFSPEQEAALRDLLLWLHRNNPDVFKLENVLGHDEIAVDSEGRLGRKQDPGGGLSMLMEDYRCDLAGRMTESTRGPLAPPTQPTGPCWETALLLATTSKLVYRDEAVVKQTMTSAPWGFAQADFLSVADTQAVVASDASRVVVAFRGSKGLGDWLGNLDFIGQAPSAFGPVHPGFSSAFLAVRSSLFAALASHDPQGSKELWLTGHSLGGALALLTATEVNDPKRVSGIYTFGQPRAGFDAFRQKIDEVFARRYFRFVNNDDLVPRVPPGDYAHAGHLIWFNEAGLPDEQPPADVRGPGRLPGPLSPSEFAKLQEDLRSRATRGAILAAPEEEQLQRLRGEMPAGFENHRIDQYIAYVHRQKPAAVRLEVRGAVAGPEASVPLPSAEVPAEKRLDVPGFALGEQELGAFLKTQVLLPLAVHVVWSEASNPDGICQPTAGAIFEFLHQPVARELDESSRKAVLNPDLESGAGIPVFLGHHFQRVNESVSRRLSPDGRNSSATIVFLLLDHRAQAERERDTEFGRLLDTLFAPNRIASYRPDVLIVPVCLDAAARSVVPDGLDCLLERATPTAATADRAAMIAWQAGLTTAHFLMQRRGQTSADAARVKLFVSYSRTDIDRSAELASAFQKKVNEEFGDLFTSEDVPVFRERQPAKNRITDNAVILIVRSDSYSATPGTLRDVLDAKRSGLPIVTLNVLREGRGRSFSCEGNSITLAWNPTTPRGTMPEPVDFHDLTWRCLQVCLRAWLHHLHFHLLPPAVFQLRDVAWKPDLVTAISRPPELLDFVQGPLLDVGSGIVLYPDPPLSSSETKILRRAQPKVRLATPTSLSNEVWRRTPTPPLSGLKVALSLSISPDLATDFAQISPEFAGSRSNGVLATHMDVAVAYLTLSLVRGGASLGFGGSVREISYASFLSDLIATHKQTAQTKKDLLRTFLTPYSAARADQAKDEVAVTECGPVVTDPPASPLAQRALDLSRMRHRMAQDCDLRIIMGGRTSPELLPGDGGYLGRFPGQAEEALQALRAGKPLYVAGGFLGVSSFVARALCNQIEGLPKEAQWWRSPHHAELCQDYDAVRLAKWGLPGSLDALWQAFAEFGKGFFWGEGSENTGQLWTNGLTVAENLRLFSAVQADHLSALITKGIEKVITSRHHKGDPSTLSIALFNGSFTDVPDTEGYAALVLGSARLRGADAALNERLQGLLQRSMETRRGGPVQTIRIATDQLPGDYVLLYWLDSIKPGPDESWLKAEITKALQSFVAAAAGHRIGSLALVPMGVNLGLTPEQSAELIIRAFLDRPADCAEIDSIALCEIDPLRYDRIMTHVLKLAAESDGRLTCSEMEPQIPKSLRVPLFLNFTEVPPKDRKSPPAINQSARGTGGGGAVAIVDQPIDWAQHAAAFDAQKGLPPAFAEHQQKGLQLAELILCKTVRDCIVANRSLPWEILHDRACSRIPFEMMAFQTESGEIYHPALEVGVCRRLGSHEAGTVPNYSAKARYQLLMVADPTDNLPGARREAAEIHQTLTQEFGRPNSVPSFEITSLIGSRQATLSAVLDEIGSGRYDFIHYAGHGNHDANPKKSGLLFKQGYLTAEDLQNSILQKRKARKAAAAAAGHKDPGHPPALVILNACLVANLIHRVGNQAFNQASLAQAVLEAGIGGFIGNRWLVGDSSAALFSSTVYSLLAKGTQLGDAVCQARRELHQAGSPDWANYELYGTREIRL